MPLAPGVHLGPYEILGLAADLHRRARFEREARSNVVLNWFADVQQRLPAR